MITIDVSKIWVVICIFNRKELTLSCLQSLYEQTITGFNVVVVDDGSTDGSTEAINTLYPQVIVIRKAGDLWWSASMNIGVKYAISQGADYVLSLNNDLEVSDDYMEKMIIWAKAKPDALFGSHIFDISNFKSNWAGSTKNWKKCSSINVLDEYNEKDRKGIIPISHFCGRGLWVPASVFQKIGYFDEKHLPQYCADDDFTFRAVKNGFDLYGNLDAKLYSHVDESGAEKNKKDASFKGYFQHLFGVKSFGNLKNFTIIALRHCPKRYLLRYWILGITARIIRFPLRKWILR